MNARSALPPLGAGAVFFALAVLSGNSVRNHVRVDISGNLDLFGSGLERLRRVAASALYLQMDDYHHIGMYQGQSWATITDYLPQAWMVSRLDPGFSVVYADAAYHLAVNLGMVEEGLDFIREGLRHNPDSLDTAYQYPFLMFQTRAGSPEEVFHAVVRYNMLVRRRNGDAAGPYRERSAIVIAQQALSEIMPEMSEIYGRRSDFLSRAIRAGLYHPGYLSESPEPGIGGVQ